METTPPVLQRTYLHIEEDQTVISIESPDADNIKLVLPLGSVKTGSAYFKHAPPTAAEIEQAIDVVEDELSRIHKSVPGGPMLYTTDQTIRQVAMVAGIVDQGDVVLSRELVEQTFIRLADLAMGRPVAQDNMPTSPEFAAALLILREFMHHLQFSAITVTTEE